MVAFLGFYGQYLANGLVRPAAAGREASASCRMCGRMGGRPC